MADFYFVSEKTGKKYKVISFDQAAGTVTLKGETGGEFTEKYTKERFQEMGYKLVQEVA